MVSLTDARLPEYIVQMLDSVQLVDSVEQGHKLGRQTSITPDGYRQDTRGGIFVGVTDLYCGASAGGHRKQQIDSELGRLRQQRDGLEAAMGRVPLGMARQLTHSRSWMRLPSQSQPLRMRKPGPCQTSGYSSPPSRDIASATVSKSGTEKKGLMAVAMRGSAGEPASASARNGGGDVRERARGTVHVRQRRVRRADVLDARSDDEGEARLPAHVGPRRLLEEREIGRAHV